MSLASFILHGLGASTILAAQPTPTSTITAPQANPTVCGDIVQANLQLNQTVFNASTVYECMVSVPFNAAIASRFIKYCNDTLQFQSTLAYLKNPPPEYQQPGTDLIAGLGRLQQAVNQGLFSNQYSFEATLQTLLYSAHDSHINLVSGVLGTFKFAAPWEIVSVSTDGVQLPKVYVFEDLIAQQTTNTSLGWTPSAISTIDGQDVTQYLTNIAAANSVGNLEPHSDWNDLMRSPAIDVQGFWEVFGGSITFYPGATLDVVFENGTDTGPLNWLAFYNSPGDPGPLETGGDFYNFFVLGLYPAAHFDQFNLTDTSDTNSTTNSTATTDTTSDNSTTADVPQATSWGNLGYPDPADVVQPDLGTVEAGILTGYFLNDTLIGVLSIPSFDEAGDSIGTFAATVRDFILRSKQAGMKKIIIDVQRNSGGNTFLAIDTYKQFFPANEPFLGSRRRIHPFGEALGETITQVFDSLATDDEYYYDLSADEWEITDKLDARDNQNFTSWNDYYTPSFQYNGDKYSEVERYNLSSFVFTVDASGGITIFGEPDDPADFAQPYAAEDMIILSDGLCSSACALFMEMMHHESGVRTVVAGGRPRTGPMQAPAQSRGARDYTVDIMDADFAFAQALNDTAAAVTPNRTDQDVYVAFMSINLRDQTRKNDNTPLQFKYEAADCRIFFTVANFYNYSQLWRDAASAIWANSKLCVSGSTGFSYTGNTTATNKPPTASNLPDASLANLTGVKALPQGQGKPPASDDTFGVIPDDSGNFASLSGQPCLGGSTCPGQLTCESVTVCNGGKQVTSSLCVPTCTSTQSNCGLGFSTCQLKTTSAGLDGKSFHEGFCVPVLPKFCTEGIKSKKVGPRPPPGIGGFR